MNEISRTSINTRKVLIFRSYPLSSAWSPYHIMFVYDFREIEIPRDDLSRSRCLLLNPPLRPCTTYSRTRHKKRIYFVFIYLFFFLTRSRGLGISYLPCIDNTTYAIFACPYNVFVQNITYRELHINYSLSIYIYYIQYTK